MGGYASVCGAVCIAALYGDRQMAGKERHKPRMNKQYKTSETNAGVMPVANGWVAGQQIIPAGFWGNGCCNGGLFHRGQPFKTRNVE